MSKKHNKNESKNISSQIAIGAGVTALLVGGVSYYLYEDYSQIIDNKIFENDIFIDDEGNMYHYFAPGEHRIKISRNDIFHTIEKVEGYQIESVKINEWRSNNVVIYVNEYPVIAKATDVTKNGIIFSKFGVVVEKQKVYKK